LGLTLSCFNFILIWRDVVYIKKKKGKFCLKINRAKCVRGRKRRIFKFKRSPTVFKLQIKAKLVLFLDELNVNPDKKKLV
jgi:hypothetical protein